MRWRVFGKKQAAVPLVLIHGGHGSWLHWVRNIEVLAREHQVLVPDLPGFGDSDDAPDGATIAIIAQGLRDSLDTLLGGPRTIDLAGFSFGGIVSARVAVQRGGVRRLALLGCPASETPKRPRAKLIRWRNADEAVQNAALRHNMLAHMLYAEADVDDLTFRAYADAVKATRYSSRGGAHSVPLEELLAPYADPVLFLYGEHDVICTPELAKLKLDNRNAGRECRVIPGSGHWVQHERAHEVNDALLQWFSTDVAAPSPALSR